MRRARLPATLTVLLVLCPIGCGPRTYPVHGKLVWQDGSPAKELAGGLIVFQSTEAPRAARGEIQHDGSFRLTTHRPDDGALPGPYTICFSEPSAVDTDRPRPLIAHKRYENPKTSKLEFTVLETTNEPVLKIERAPSKKKR